MHERLVSEEASRGSGRPSPVQAQGVYSGSWAVLIGINEYRSWPKLNYAVNDAKSLRGTLIKLGFDPGKIIELYDQAATKENILRVVADELPRKTGPNDRVLFFFAGHGQTEELPGGIKRGYLAAHPGQTYPIRDGRVLLGVGPGQG